MSTEVTCACACYESEQDAGVCKVNSDCKDGETCVQGVCKVVETQEDVKVSGRPQS